MDHDVIIVGGGSAGAVLAARLTENADRTVLLLEAGSVYPPRQYPAILANANVVGGDADHDWGYLSEPGYVGHPIHVIRGKVLGGSSAVNGAVAVRAPATDFLRWSRHGLEGWSFAEVLETYKRLENVPTGHAAWHGRNGPFPIRQPSMASLTPSCRAFVEAGDALRLKRIEDFNGPSWWRSLLSSAGMVEVVTSALVGVFCGLFAYQYFGWSATPTLSAIGGTGFLLSPAAHLLYQVLRAVYARQLFAAGMNAASSDNNRHR